MVKTADLTVVQLYPVMYPFIKDFRTFGGKHSTLLFARIWGHCRLWPIEVAKLVLGIANLVEAPKAPRTRQRMRGGGM